MVEKAGSEELLFYADDLKFFNEIKSEEDVEELQKDLDKFMIGPSTPFSNSIRRNV